MNLSTIDLSGVTPMMAGMSSIPKVQFKPGHDLHKVSSFLTERLCFFLGKLDDANMTKEERLVAIMNYLDETKNDPEFAPIFAGVESLSNGLYLNIQNLFNQMKDEVAPKVAELTDRVYEQRDMELMNSGAEVLINVAREPEVDYVTMDWKAIELLGGTDRVMDDLRATTKMNLPTPTRSADSYLHSKLSNTISSIELAADDKDIVLRTIKKLHPSMVDTMEADLSCIMDNQAYYKLYHQILNTWKSKPCAEAVKMYTMLIDRLYPIVCVLKKTGFQFCAETTQDLVNTNIEKVRQLCYAMGYYLVSVRESMFGNSIALDETTLNSDQISQFEAGGGTLKDLTYHIRAQFKHRNIGLPFSGVTTADVLANKPQVAAAIESYNQDLQNNIIIHKHRATSLAFMYAATQYAKATVDKCCPADMSKTAYLQQAHHIATGCLNTLNGQDNSIEDAMYQFILQLNHRGTMLDMVHAKHTNAVVAAMESHNEMTSALGDIIQQSVATDVVLSFLQNTALLK